ncbi:hypothetical protein MKW94_003086 [Papaver nudicaule]|uniref:Thioredoxin domain-containing protein n=1 Tax=Papaver nudicaule TaxID=74823 RepID=A0AA41SH93_PAPNU|nr:hypothetical protein [Papaver nudicaule]
MEKIRVPLTWILMLFSIGSLQLGKSLTSSSPSPVCPVISITDSILKFEEEVCINSSFNVESVGRTNFNFLTEGNEVSLHKALNFVHQNNKEYVSVLFYGSQCHFSKTFRPTFAHVSSLYPSIHHFAVKETSIKPSTLSKYGVRGFPTLFLLNSTHRIRYHGSRTISSLNSFYSDVTGVKPAPQDQIPSEKIVGSTDVEKLHENAGQDDRSWERFPENLFQEEMYLTLATAFVILRLLYIGYPSLLSCAHCVWMYSIHNISLVNLWEHPLLTLILVLNALKGPFAKASNLQERAMNARSWASKSLASVSISER